QRGEARRQLSLWYSASDILLITTYRLLPLLTPKPSGRPGSGFVSLNSRRATVQNFRYLLPQACRDAVRALEAHFQTQPAETAWSARRTRRQRMLAFFRVLARRASHATRSLVRKWLTSALLCARAALVALRKGSA